MTESAEYKQIVAAMKRLAVLQRDKAFDPFDLDSRPTEQQLEILKNVHVQHRYCLGGNQCKPADSMIKMADGSEKQISDVIVGDTVLSMNIKTRELVPSVVTRVHHNGVKPIYRYHVGFDSYIDCTENHKLFTYLGGKLTKRRADETQNVIDVAAEFEGEDSVDPKFTELLGYFLGDGCFTKFRTYGLQFTNTSSEIIDYVSSLIDPGYQLREIGNGDFFLSRIAGTKGTNKYINYIRGLGLEGLKAKDKFIPDYVYTQSIKTRRKFIGGMIATDGWISSGKYPDVGFSTTSRKMANGLKRLLASVGIYSTVKIRERSNPNHNDEYTVRISKSEHYNKFLREIFVPSKVGTPMNKGMNYNPFGTRKITHIEFLRNDNVFDITVSHKDHNYIADGFLVSNSGKSNLGGRELSWIKLGIHPYWDPSKLKEEVRERWFNQPKLFIVCGRTMSNVEIELWNKKLKPFFEPGTYRVVRTGGVLQRVEFDDGDTILFVSHHAPSESVEKIQGYVAHYVWLDEMPDNFKMLEELHRRVQANQGPFLATFTPKLRNDEIRRLVDTPSSVHRKFTLSMLKNPIYKNPDRQREILEQMQTYSEEYRNTLLEGSWYVGESAVYDFRLHEHTRARPENYTNNWRHIVTVDPAASGKVGFIIWGENPRTGKWHSIHAEYLDGAAATVLHKYIEEFISAQQLNVIRRVSDPHEAWFIKESEKPYMGVYQKNQRKKELIKQLQEALYKGQIVIDPDHTELIDEFVSCQWHESVKDKIVGASRFHLLDAAQYFVDNIPKFVPGQEIMSPLQELRMANKLRIEKEQKKKKALKKDKPVRMRRKRWGRRNSLAS